MNYTSKAHRARVTGRITFVTLALACGGTDDESTLTGPSERNSTVSITAGPENVRQGDVTVYSAEARDDAGNPLTVSWSVSPAGAGFVSIDGRFVGYAPRTAALVASAGAAADTLEVTIAPRGLTRGNFAIVRQGMETDRATADLWVHGDYAYLGTLDENKLWVYDISNPASPTLTSSMSVPAFNVNDVKVRADGAIAVITREDDQLFGARSGISILDLTDPANPVNVIDYGPREFTEFGIHNVWIEGDFVYVAATGTTAGSRGLYIVDISDPANPQIVANYWGGSSYVHDVFVRDGLAFVSHWNGGLVILDVGNGITGGSPTNPQFVGDIALRSTHNAWYWPAGGYVFVGEEDFSSSAGPGRMHVIDVGDLTQPVVVATFSVPGDIPHNFWMDEAAEVLYMAWYEGGVRALDVSGEMLGALDKQGRGLANIQYDGSGNCEMYIRAFAIPTTGTCSWAPQLHNGLIFVSDIVSGLWVLEPPI